MYKNTGKDMKPAYNTQQEEFKDRLARLKSNVMFNPNLQDYKKMAFDPKKETIRSNYNTIKEDVERLTEMISGGEIPGKALASFSEDLTSMNYYLGTLANTGNPIVETFHKLFEARMNAYRKAILEDEQNLNHYLLPLVNQQRKKKNLSTINNDKDMRKYISSINVIDLYGHLYLEYKDTEGNTRRGLKRLESDMQDLTDIDKSMLKFLNAHYDSFFENTPNNIALLNRAYTYRLNQFGEYEELSALDVYNGKSYRKQGQEQRN